MESRDLGYPAYATTTYRRLIEPIEHGLGNVDRLVLIPVGPLWLLPFQALLETTLKEAVAAYDVIHLATHPILEQAQPMYSSILLSAGEDGEEDGLLEVREIEALDFNARLVVLSACSTANGRVVAGEGVVGLAGHFSRGAYRRSSAASGRRTRRAPPH